MIVGLGTLLPTRSIQSSSFELPASASGVAVASDMMRLIRFG